MPFKSEAQRKYLWANEPEIARDWTDTYGSGIKAAYGGMIGSVGGMSRPKYQEGNMVGAEMEGAEMEGAMMQSQEVIKELYDALIAQGLSPQEAMEKIKQIIASSQAQEPESPMMAEEFPGQEFGRTPAAFGGIMDTYTGRRKYGLGSTLKKLVSKGTKAIKKLASSKVGKLALMYAAGTYLGGTQFMSGMPGGVGPGGLKSVAARLKNPKLLANLLKTDQWGTALSKTPVTTGFNVGNVNKFPAEIEKYKNVLEKDMSVLDKFKFEQATKNYLNTLKPAAKETWIDKLPGGAMTAIGLPSVLAGAYTAAQPPEELGGEVMGEYDTKKSDFDKYLASLEGDYRVPENLRLTSAQGGRIGYRYGKNYKSKKEIPEELIALLKGIRGKGQMPAEIRALLEGVRPGRQEGGLMNLGGMEKDYRNDGGFVPIGGQEKADDVPARLSRNEFVFTADAVRNAGGGDIDKGAEVMENVMKNLEGGGQISEESQGQGAQEMFETSERLSEVI